MVTVMRISITAPRDFAEENEANSLFYKQLVQLGVECIDIGSGADWPGVKEEGVPDLDAVLRIKRSIRARGLEINRVTLPDLSDSFMQGAHGSEIELDHTCQAMKVFSEAGFEVVRQRFAGDSYANTMESYRAVQRGGIIVRGERLREKPNGPTHEQLEAYWQRFCAAYDRLVPLAEQYNMLLAMHPSDTPNPETPFNSLGFHRIIDAFPSRNVGFVYCVGTRAQAGGTPLVLDEIRNYGRKGRIFSVHFRNVRGSIPTVGGFEEALLDDGDMNMFNILLELKKTGFSGCINPDHLPELAGDDRHRIIACSYAVGYIKALLCAVQE